MSAQHVGRGHPGTEAGLGLTGVSASSDEIDAADPVRLLDIAPEPVGDIVPDLVDAGSYSSFHDVDTSAEVDAAFRSQRRIATTYLVVFVVVVAMVALGTVALPWATADQAIAGFSPSFLAIAVGLYLFFVVIGVAAASLANGVDDRMMGANSLPPSPWPGASDDGRREVPEG